MTTYMVTINVNGRTLKTTIQANSEFEAKQLCQAQYSNATILNIIRQH